MAERREAVLEVDLARPLEPLAGYHGYAAARVIVRYHGRPLGQAQLELRGGGADRERVRRAVLAAAGERLAEAWLEHALAPPPAPVPAATVAVCTRDRPEDLARSLDALVALPDDGQELLVVDSASAGATTRRVVAQYAGRVRYVREDLPGLNRARNRALREARHDRVAFIDDDAVADGGWLRSLLRGFDEPLVWCVTGLTLPLELETEAQRLQEQFASFGRGWDSRLFADLPPTAAGGVGAGVNMVLHRDAARHLGGFDEALDAGTASRSGGDTEMFARILAAGYRIAYRPAALVRHRHRRDAAALRRAFFGYGVGVYAAWTRMLLREGELGVLRAGFRWFFRDLLRELVRGMRGRPATPPTIQAALIAGALVGPWAYLAARRRTHKEGAWTLRLPAGG